MPNGINKMRPIRAIRLCTMTSFLIGTKEITQIEHIYMNLKFFNFPINCALCLKGTLMIHVIRGVMMGRQKETNIYIF